MAKYTYLPTYENNMVHNDIKPGNILVTNTHYAHETKYLASLFEKKPVICKLADLVKDGPKWLKLKHYFLTKQSLLKKEHPLLWPQKYR